MGLSTKWSGTMAQDVICSASTALSTASCQDRSAVRASGVSFRKTARSHAWDWRFTKWNTICAWQLSRACSSMGPWSEASMFMAPPKWEAA